MKTPSQSNTKNSHKKHYGSKSKLLQSRPSRPLTAYNMFFAIERSNIIRQQQEEDSNDHAQYNRSSRSSKVQRANVGFANLARIVSERWKTIDPVFKKALEDKARLNKIRYQREMKEWNLTQKMNEELDEMKAQARHIEPMEQVKHVSNQKMQWAVTREVSYDISVSNGASPVATKKEAMDFFREIPASPFAPSKPGHICVPCSSPSLSTKTKCESSTVGTVRPPLARSFMSFICDMDSKFSSFNYDFAPTDNMFSITQEAPIRFPFVPVYAAMSRSPPMAPRDFFARSCSVNQ